MGDIDRFSTLGVALYYAELTGVFEGNDQYTVFAHNNTSFENLVETLSADPVWNQKLADDENPFAAIDDLLGPFTVANVLHYHTALGGRATKPIIWSVSPLSDTPHVFRYTLRRSPLNGRFQGTSLFKRGKNRRKAQRPIPEIQGCVWRVKELLNTRENSANRLRFAI